MNSNDSRMRFLVDKLREASKAYYQESREIMSNYEYDALYDELLRLEEETGIILSGSPTQNVGYEILSELPKENHEKPMLSLNKTKDVDELVSWLGDKKALLSWKLDGLTVVLTYADGELKKGITRGNGITGEVITANVRNFDNVPVRIPFRGNLTLRGEAVIKYADFEKINDSIADTDAKYKNPRNLCSGSVRQLDPQITKSRHVGFYAFSLVSADGVDFENSRLRQFEWLRSQGFDVVDYVMTDAVHLSDDVKDYSVKIENYDIPSDGLVLLLDDIAYGESLGTTAKFPRNAIAFKWSDETRETKLKYIEWSPSRTGLINPVAVFEPVELEGTTVSRASVHNVSILEDLKLAPGDTITVYKANMIIPQIAENLTGSGAEPVPEICPVCGGRTKILDENGVRTLYCTNPECQAKKIKSYALLTSRDALNVDGLSEMTLEKLIGAGCIKSPADIFRLNRFRDVITSMEGFGDRSYENMMAAIDNAKKTTLSRFIYSLGIPGIGSANAKVLAKAFNYSFSLFKNAEVSELCEVDGIGTILAQGIREFFDNDNNSKTADELMSFLTFEDESESTESQIFEGKTFVITGSLMHFSNRKELEEAIEKRGGRTASSVSTKTDYLINNDLTSASSKNKKAHELGIPIIDEDSFMEMAGLL